MFSYGFYNSLNGDRKYDAVQVSSIFDGVIEDGVYANIGEFFAVVPGASGLQVTVKTGRAWFNHTWSLNDAYLPLDIDPPDVLQTRIDAVVLEVDSRVEKRENSIKIVRGIPSVNPLKPNLLNTGGVYQHVLAYVTVKPDAESIKAEDIEIVVGKSETPFVQCPLKTVPIDDLFNQWDSEFNTWFDNVKLQMTDNVVTNLQRQIDEKVNVSDKATDEDIVNKNPSKWIGADKLEKAMDRVGDTVTSSIDLESETNGEYVALDGRAINISEVPINLVKEISNRYVYSLTEGIVHFPYANYSNGSASNANIGNNARFMTAISDIGDIQYYFTSVYPMMIAYNKKTRTVLNFDDLGRTDREYMYGSGYWAIVGNYLYKLESHRIEVYDQNLKRIREHSNIYTDVRGPSAGVFTHGNKIVFVFLYNNGRDYPVVVSSTNNFASFSVSRPPNIENRGGGFGYTLLADTYNNTKSLSTSQAETGKNGSRFFIYGSRGFIFPDIPHGWSCGSISDGSQWEEYTNNFQIGAVIYSDDLYSSTSIFQPTAQDIFGDDAIKYKNLNNINGAVYIYGYNNCIRYVFSLHYYVSDDNGDIEKYFLRAYDFDCMTFKLVKKYEKELTGIQSGHLLNKAICIYKEDGSLYLYFSEENDGQNFYSSMLGQHPYNYLSASAQINIVKLVFDDEKGIVVTALPNDISVQGLGDATRIGDYLICDRLYYIDTNNTREPTPLTSYRFGTNDYIGLGVNEVYDTRVTYPYTTTIIDLNNIEDRPIRYIKPTITSYSNSSNKKYLFPYLKDNKIIFQPIATFSNHLLYNPSSNLVIPSKEELVRDILAIDLSKRALPNSPGKYIKLK